MCLAGLPIAFSLATKSGIARVSIKMIVYFGEQKANFPEFSHCGAPISMQIRMRVRLNGDGGKKDESGYWESWEASWSRIS